jgi:precorrin-6B methylase 2
MSERQKPRKKRQRESGGSGEGSSSLTAVALAYAEINGYALARDAKRQQRDSGLFLDGIQFGEIDMTGFMEALSWCSPKAGETFVDLGSGTAKAVLTAAAAYPFASAVGVEILEALHKAGQSALERCVSTLQTSDVRLVCADALEYDWSDMDIVFVSLTCFTDDMVERVRKGALRLAPGARLLVTSKSIDSDSLRLLQRGHLSYGKGKMTFLAYERL